MADTENNGRGFLYPNKDRQGRQPNMTGTVEWEGETLQIAAWTQASKKDGTKYLSLKVQRSNGTARPEEGQRVGEQITTDSDDIPF